MCAKGIKTHKVKVLTCQRVSTPFISLHIPAVRAGQFCMVWFGPFHLT